MQIWTFRKEFEALVSKFKPFERDSMLSNPIWNLSKGIQGIRIQILTIRKGFEAFECKF